MKRPAWVARRIAEQKALRALPVCDQCGIKRGMGCVVDGNHIGEAKVRWLCPSCAADARRAQRERM